MSAMRDLLASLPHREPFRFLTDLVEVNVGVSGRATWRVVGDEDFFRGHFPGDPVVPGVLLIEALAQLSGLVGGAGTGRAGGAGRLAHADVRFDSSVHPPAHVLLESAVARGLGRLTMFDVAARVGDRRIARGSVTLASLDIPLENDR